MKKAYYHENGTLLYWPFLHEEKEQGSAINTILSIISLTNYAKIENNLEQMVECLQNCGEWILRTDWNNVEEIISRPISAIKEDRLVYQHYTAPWGVIALLRLGYDKGEKKIVNEMKKILENEKNGLWHWNGESNFPIWAIYNAISAIVEFALIDIQI